MFIHLICPVAWAHVPALLLPLPGTPISSYFLGQSDISRAVYSELTQADDFFVAHFSVKSGAEATLVSLLAPACEQLPQYESFQPSALVLPGDAPWKIQGETNSAYVARLKKLATAVVASDFPVGRRPKFYEEFAKRFYWVGGEWSGQLKAGLYSIVVYDASGHKGNFTLGLNQKEAWTPDLLRYAGEVSQSIENDICSPKGFTGRLKF